MSGQQGSPGASVAQAASQLNQQRETFNPYANVQNQIVDERDKSGGLLGAANKFAQAQQQFPISGGPQLPMATSDPGLEATWQGLLGLQQQSKQNKQAVLKAFMGGG